MTILPLARRYAFLGAAQLDAARNAADPLNWAAYPLPVTVFALDVSSHDLLAAALAEQEDAILVTVDTASALPEILSAALAKETARYVQFAHHVIEDFGPALALVMDRLEAGDAAFLRADMMRSGRHMHAPDAAPCAEASWLKTDLLRNALKGGPTGPEALFTRAVTGLEPLHIPVLAGGYYACKDDEPEEAGALWRARCAASWREVDRLRSERRIRLGREAALKARHARDMTRQTERMRAEINRLHRAAGWAGRWRARLSGWLGRA